MELLPQGLRESLPKLYAQEKNKDPTVHVKFFTPDAGWTWFATEGQAEGEDFIFFGVSLRQVGYCWRNLKPSISIISHQQSGVKRHEAL
jgi:hypothetical protein